MDALCSAAPSDRSRVVRAKLAVGKPLSVQPYDGAQAHWPQEVTVEMHAPCVLDRARLSSLLESLQRPTTRWSAAGLSASHASTAGTTLLEAIGGVRGRFYSTTEELVDG